VDVYDVLIHNRRRLSSGGFTLREQSYVD